MSNQPADPADDRSVETPERFAESIQLAPKRNRPQDGRQMSRSGRPGRVSRPPTHGMAPGAVASPVGLSQLHMWLMCLVPALAFAYPALIQPLIELKPVSAYSDLDFSANLDNAEGNSLNQLFWIGLLPVVLYLCRARVALLLRAFATRPGQAIAGFLFVAACSIGWSDVPDIATRRLILQVIVIACTFAATAMGPASERMLRLIVGISLVTALINTGFVLLQPPGRLGGWIGIYAHKNLLGVNAALFLIFGMYQLGVTRGGLGRLAGVLLLASASFILIASHSRTSQGLALMCPLLAFFAMWAVRRFGISPALAVASLFAAGAIVLMDAAVIGGLTFADLSNLLFGDATFSDRTTIWDFVLQQLRDRPVTGYGYGSFWAAGNDSVAFQRSSGFIRGLLQAHNGYLDVLIETGWAGIMFLVALLVAVPGSLVRKHSSANAQSWLLVTIFLFALLHNLLESSWFRAFSIQWVTFLIAIGQGVAAKIKAGLVEPLEPRLLTDGSR